MEDNLSKATPAEGFMHKATQIAKALTALAIALAALLATFPDLIDKATTAFCKIYSCEQNNPDDRPGIDQSSDTQNKASTSVTEVDAKKDHSAEANLQETAPLAKPQLSKNKITEPSETTKKNEMKTKLENLTNKDTTYKFSEQRSTQDSGELNLTKNSPPSYKALYGGFCFDMIAYHFTDGKWNLHKISSTLNKKTDRLTLYIASKNTITSLKVSIPTKNGNDFDTVSLQRGDVASKDLNKDWNYILPDGRLFDCDTLQARSGRNSGYSLPIDITTLPNGTYKLLLKPNESTHWTVVINELIIQ
ncbi:hypothetical protein [Pseudomonas azerbaijanoccidentalis]